MRSHVEGRGTLMTRREPGTSSPVGGVVQQWVGADEASRDGASPLNPVFSGLN